MKNEADEIAGKIKEILMVQYFWFKVFPQSDSDPKQIKEEAMRYYLNNVAAYKFVRETLAMIFREVPISALVEDKKRLDWLECATSQNYLFGCFVSGGSNRSLRIAIDAAMPPKS